MFCRPEGNATLNSNGWSAPAAVKPGTALFRDGKFIPHAIDTATCRKCFFARAFEASDIAVASVTKWLRPLPTAVWPRYGRSSPCLQSDARRLRIAWASRRSGTARNGPCGSWWQDPGTNHSMTEVGIDVDLVTMMEIDCDEMQPTRMRENFGVSDFDAAHR